MNTFSQSVVEEAALEWFEGLGYSVLGGPEIAYGEPAAERTDPEYRDMILEGIIAAFLLNFESRICPSPPLLRLRLFDPQMSSGSQTPQGRMRHPAQPARGLDPELLGV
jgi:hypothetical protein